ncbi:MULTISPECIES: TfoX/Sxy family protein [Burkholderia]|uniref:TfoX/Sxy family protein n=1 Tax=Burkholderia TaxID=32008 RepID=UPI000863ADFB|nr:MULTISPECIES: TfoX/Sxy family protein [Burkholderia]AOL08312.1 competence protein TfoX [Burkholderia contaminans]TCW68115.1 competence protein TfoX [Burkholderia sp. SRS-25]
MSWQSEKAHGEEIAYQLAPLGNVTVVRFFSGAAMRLDGVMFGFMSRGSLFLRVDDVNRPGFVAAGMGPFSYERPTRTVSLDGYYETPADVLEDAGALFDWCRSAYRAALLAGPPKRKARAVQKAAAPEAKPVSKRAAKPVSVASSKSVPAPEAKPASKRAAKPVSKAFPRPAPAEEVKPVSKALPKPAPAEEAKPASKRVAKLASKASPKPASAREAKPASKRTTKPASKPAAKSPAKRKQA